MTILDFRLDLEPMVRRAVEQEITRYIGETSYNSYSRDTPNAKIRTLVEQSMDKARQVVAMAIQDGIFRAAEGPEIRVQIAKSTVDPIARAVAGGMGNTFKELGRDLGNDPKFREALLGHVRRQLIPENRPAIPAVVKAALGQASFALRELLPDHPDAKFTVEMIKEAQDEIARIEGKA